MQMVAPFAGAWIEISYHFIFLFSVFVAPFAGAWIEILTNISNFSMNMSLPSRERGLKFQNICRNLTKPIVAPFAGAWIEIIICVSKPLSFYRRSLRGSVD